MEKQLTFNKSEYNLKYRLEHLDYFREYFKIRNAKKIRFKGKQILLSSNPRKGICSQCGHVGETDMHHKEYHDDDLLEDTIELCKSCHTKEHWKLKRQAKTI